jgi:cardiolipin synthase A/B
VRVRGPVVRGLQGAFAENWLECTGDVLAGDRYLPYIEAIENGGPMQVMRSSATMGDTNAEALVYLALAAAKESIELTSAYFVPRPVFTQALVEAAERGVQLRILVPGSHIDKEFVRTAGRAAYEALLGAGIEIFEYLPTMLHAKTLTVDGIWSSIGSVNFDNRSFQLHDEVTLCVQSEAFAGTLHDAFERDLESSERIDPDLWADRPVTQRARERVTKYARREL